MCTSVSWNSKDHYFGRNLDLEYCYNETVTITPRNYPFIFRKMGNMGSHYAMIGIATVMDDYPLYYDATNEMGLSIAGLNFPGNAVYHPPCSNKDNVTPFEFIPWVLGQCANVDEAKLFLDKINLVNIPYSPELPLSPLHWHIADAEKSIVVEPMETGVKVFDNPVGVLTNNPPFDFHLQNLGQYLNVTPHPVFSRFATNYPLTPWSRGMGGLGLPGDFSSASRFVKASFVKLNSLFADSEEESVSQFFHILSSVAMPRGSVMIDDSKPDITRYSSCCNTDKGIFYYQTYDNSRIYGVNLHRENLNGSIPVSYPLITHEPIMIQN